MIPAGSQNSLARGMGTHSVYTALYCLLKRKVRYFDGMLVENGAHLCRYAFAGCGWGIISDMVQEYEHYRCFKQYRYWLLKGIHGCFCRRNHYCSFKYIEDDNQIRLLCNHSLPSVFLITPFKNSVKNALNTPFILFLCCTPQTLF